jgi:peptidoglycan/LPS O-acetylase OafA/YrhL
MDDIAPKGDPGQPSQTTSPIRMAGSEPDGDWSALIRGHILQMDGLRGLAILLVLFYHFAARFSVRFREFHDSGDVVVQASRKLLGAGWCGVDLFFVLSGFLITGILCDTKKSTNYFSSFYLRRLLRIFPLYYGFLFAALILLPLVWKSSQGSAFLQENQAWYWAYLTNWLCAIKGGFNSIKAGYLWSLAVEEQFYLIWPFVVYFLSRRALLFTCMALLLCSVTARFVLTAFGVSGGALYVMTCTHLDPLLIGALLALAFRTSKWTTKHLRLYRLVALLSVAGLALLFLVEGEFKFWQTSIATVGILLLSLLFGYALSAALVSRQPSMLYKALTTAPLRSFGQYSYAIYVFHPPIGDALASYFNPAWYKGVSNSLMVPFLCFTASAIFVSWTAGFISWHVYEKHFLKLKKYCAASKG